MTFMSKKVTTKRNNLEEVYNSSIKFLTPLSLKQTYKVFMDEVLRLVDGKYGSILLINKGRINRVYSTSPILDLIKPRDRGYTYSVISSKTVRILNVKQIEKIHPDIKKAKIKYDAIIPLINRNKSIGVFSVLSSHKFNNSQLRLLQLFSPLGTLAIRKAQLYEQISKEIETRELFISLASHELRTPITSAYIHLQMIERNYIKNKPFDINWVITLQNEMERLSTIINELLELNQVRNGKLPYSWQVCNINEILERVFISFKARYDKREIKVKNLLPINGTTFIGDFNKLVGVFLNLLDNAVKHSRSESEIKIIIKSNNKFIIVSVIDKGTGIPKNDQEKIFKDFYKAKGNTKPGMGLGLFLAKEIIQKHKGKIVVNSEEGKGSEFRVELPLSTI